MIQIIYGVPGSGKSYYAVYNIKKIIDKNKDNVVLISNIENLKLSHINLDEIIQRYGGIDNFFNVDNEFWKTDIEKKKILFIDESQRYFNKKFFSSTVFFFFQYHRHLNVDIYLITQSYKTLPTELVVLSEVVIQAVPSSFRFFRSSFRYLIKDLETFETIEKIDIPFKKEIADLYTSALIIQENKKMTYTQKYIFFSVLLVSVALIILFFVFPKLLFLSLHNSKTTVNQTTNQTPDQTTNQTPNQTTNQTVNQTTNQTLEDVIKLIDDGFRYPENVTTKQYLQKQISYGEFLNKYRNGVVYDLSVNYIAVYDDKNNVKKVYLYKDLSTQQENTQ